MGILYGVVGEGMGHAMRSRVVLDALTAKHEVQVVVSGRAYDYLAKRASDVLSVKKIWGYTLAYEDNDEINDTRLGEFLERLPDCERRLATYQQDGNKDLLSSLEKTLEAAARGQRDASE